MQKLSTIILKKSVFNLLCYHQPLLHSGLISVLFQSSNFGVSKLKALCSASWSDSGSHPAD
uniref:Uncharacterized protein n=1 Tax=Salix viminalis TaxID=40686 RepID=A0A6N2M8S8_SALVM